MYLRMHQLSGVENPRHYRTEIIEELEELLHSGSSAIADPKRKGFYDLENSERLFFIHISPADGMVALLAVWLLRSRGGVESADCVDASMRTSA